MVNNIIKNSRNTKNAPNNLVSTQSVAFSHYNHISGQLPLDPKTLMVIYKHKQSNVLITLKRLLKVLIM
ncbi:hypothetical protein CZ814_02525 [Photobacterium toruni]|uniref:Uncharacterized protein n=1 Tax=Photobacterium toruni TaxID=1935446 RepID=A0A1T4TVX2_9GAMM|nr:hypothetical protein CZ814_02525 [Photobacterium toruni]